MEYRYNKYIVPNIFFEDTVSSHPLLGFGYNKDLGSQYLTPSTSINKTVTKLHINEISVQ